MKDMKDLSFQGKDLCDVTTTTRDITALRQQLVAEVNKLIDLICAKRADYGAYNMNRFGERGIVIRVSDKINRLITLTSLDKAGTADETIEDTWRDIAGYALLALIARKE